MELIEVDALDTERLPGSVAGAPQMCRAGVALPRTTGADESSLGGDDHLLRSAAPSPERAGDEPFVMPDLPVVKAIRVGGVDEGDAGIEGGVENQAGGGLVGAALDRQGHAAEPDEGDGWETGAERAGMHEIRRRPGAVA